MKRPLAIITGGTQGIGLGIAEELHADFDLALIFKSQSDLAESVAKKLREKTSSLSVRCYPCDVTQFTEVENTYKRIKADFNQTPYVLVNCAGLASSSVALLEEVRVFEQTMAINYFGVVYFCKLVVQDMVRAKGGRIINISSASVSNNTKGHSAYSASKAAMEKFSHILGGEVAKYGITVNTLRPFVVLTKMTENWYNLLSEEQKKDLLAPSGRLTDKSSVNKTVRFLIESPQINCTSITVDGGNANFVSI